jgi:aspartokinase
MSIIVQKYGGSSVSTVENINVVARRVVATVEQGYQVVVVVSAMGNTTNELIALAKKVHPSPPLRELDLLVSVGERVSMSLLAMAIDKLQKTAKSFTGSQSGIVTNTQHGSADVIDVHPHRILRALEDGHIAIVAGFQGMSVDKEVTTLGRGGSDTTAVALAAALKAEYCEICSDVAGVYSTDPRLVPEAILLSELGLEQAIAMAKNGAKVLQLEALEWCQRAGINLVANATKNPFGTGTVLRNATKQNSVVLTIDTQLGMISDPSLEVQEKLAPYIRYATNRNGSMVWIVDRRNIHFTIEVEPVATISIIGDMEVSLRRLLYTHPKVQFWWQDAVGISAVVAVEHSKELLQEFHAYIYTNTET